MSDRVPPVSSVISINRARSSSRGSTISKPPHDGTRSRATPTPTFFDGTNAAITAAHIASGSTFMRPSERAAFVRAGGDVVPSSAATAAGTVIELFNPAEHTQRVDSRVPLGEPLFSPSPRVIVFRAYGPWVPTTARLTLRNRDTVPRRISARPLESPFFDVSAPRNSRNESLPDSRIAPGTEVTYIITFKPRGVADYAADLVFHTEREKFIVPLRAAGPRSALTFPDAIDFGDAPIRLSVSRVFVVRNVGERAAEFELTPPQGWTVVPTRAVVGIGQHVSMTATFTPADAGAVTGELQVALLTDGGTAFVALRGMGVELPLALSDSRASFTNTYISLSSASSVSLRNDSDTPIEFNWLAHGDANGETAARAKTLENRISSFNNEVGMLASREDFDVASRAASNIATSGLPWDVDDEPLVDADSVASLMVFGASTSILDIDADCGDDGALPWAPEALPSAPAAAIVRHTALLALRRKYRALTAADSSSPLNFSSSAFTVSPSRGTVWARSTVDFSLAFTPPSAGVWSEVAFLDATGLAARIPLQLEGLALAPALAFAFDRVDVGDVTMSSRHRYVLTVSNKGDVGADWFVAAGENTRYSSLFSFTPPRGRLEPGSVASLTVMLSADELGAFTESFTVFVEGAGPAARVVFIGAIVPPSLAADTDVLSFGRAPFGFPAIRRLCLVNTSDVAFTFGARVPLDGAVLPVGTTAMGSARLLAASSARKKAGGLTALPLELASRFEFSVIPSVGTLTPGTRAEIEVILTSQSTGRDYRDEGFELVFGIDGVGEGMLRVPIEAEGAVPAIAAEPSSLYFGDLFIRHTYKKTLTIRNTSAAMPARFLVVPQDAGTRTLARVDVTPSDGIVPPDGSLDILVRITPLRLVPLAIPITLGVAGDWDGEPLRVTLHAKGRGPRVLVEPSMLDLGSGPCLVDTRGILTLINASDIPAPLSYFVRSRRVFSTPPIERTLEPGERLEVVITARPDDACVHTDELCIAIAESEPMTVPLRIRGVGATLWGTWRNGEGTVLWSGVDFSNLDLGALATSAPGVATLSLENRGQRACTLNMSNTTQRAREMTVKRDAKRAGSVVRTANAPTIPPPPQPPVFTTEPAFISFKPGGAAVVTFSGSTSIEGSVEEFLDFAVRCDGEQSATSVVSPRVHALFANPGVIFLPSSIHFTHAHSPTFDEPNAATGLLPSVRQTAPLSFQNTSPLPLSFVLRTAPPFSIEGSVDWRLAPGESGTVVIGCDPLYRVERVCHTARSALVAVYAGNPKRDSASLSADLAFPALTADRASIDFGTVLPSTKATQLVTLRNPTPLPAAFAWSFVNEVATDSPVPLLSPFDILPTRGIIEPGAVQLVELVFTGVATAAASRSKALCSVAGGADVFLNLLGDVGGAAFSVEPRALDLGRLLWDGVAEGDFWITNTGRIDYTFSVGVAAVSRMGTLIAAPSSGRLTAGSRVRVRIHLMPGVPGPVAEPLTITVGPFAPITIPVTALAGFATGALDLPRLPGVTGVEPHEWDEAIAEATATVAQLEIIEAAAAQQALEVATAAAAVAAEEALRASEEAAALKAARKAQGLPLDDAPFVARVTLSSSPPLPQPLAAALRIDAEATRIVFSRHILARAAAMRALAAAEVLCGRDPSKTLLSKEPLAAIAIAGIGPEEQEAVLEAYAAARDAEDAEERAEEEAEADLNNLEGGDAGSDAGSGGGSVEGGGGGEEEEKSDRKNDLAGSRLPRAPVRNPLISARAPSIAGSVRGGSMPRKAAGVARSVATSALPPLLGECRARLRALPKPEDFVSARYLVDFGPVICGQNKRRAFNVTNTGSTLLSATMDKDELASAGFALNPHKLVRIREGDSLGVEAIFTAPRQEELAGSSSAPRRGALSLGPLEITAAVQIIKGPDVDIVMRALICVPDVDIRGEHAVNDNGVFSLDFGRIFVGQEATLSFWVVNTAPVQSSWSLVKPVGNANLIRDRSAFTFTPESGTLAPGGRILVVTSFIPDARRSFNVMFPIAVTYNNLQRAVRVRGIGEDHNVSLNVLPLGNISLSDVLRARAGWGGHDDERWIGLAAALGDELSRDLIPSSGTTTSSNGNTSARTLLIGTTNLTSLATSMSTPSSLPSGASPVAVLGPVHPHGRPALRLALFTNNSQAPVEVVSHDFDEQAKREEAALAILGQYLYTGRSQLMRLPTRLPGEALSPELIDEARGIDATLLGTDPSAAAPSTPSAHFKIKSNDTISSGPVPRFDSPRAHGLAIDVFVAAAMGCGGPATIAIAKRLGTPVLSLAEIVDWAVRGDGGSVLQKQGITAIFAAKASADADEALVSARSPAPSAKKGPAALPTVAPTPMEAPQLDRDFLVAAIRARICEEDCARGVVFTDAVSTWSIDEELSKSAHDAAHAALIKTLEAGESPPSPPPHTHANALATLFSDAISPFASSKIAISVRAPNILPLVSISKWHAARIASHMTEIENAAAAIVINDKNDGVGGGGGGDVKPSTTPSGSLPSPAFPTNDGDIDIVSLTRAIKSLKMRHSSYLVARAETLIEAISGVDANVHDLAEGGSASSAALAFLCSPGKRLNAGDPGVIIAPAPEINDATGAPLGGDVFYGYEFDHNTHWEADPSAAPWLRTADIPTSGPPPKVIVPPPNKVKPRFVSILQRRPVGSSALALSRPEPQIAPRFRVVQLPFLCKRALASQNVPMPLHCADVIESGDFGEPPVGGTCPDGPGRWTIAPGGTAIVAIRFASSIAGSWTGTLSFGVAGLPHVSILLPVTGVAQVPAIATSLSEIFPGRTVGKREAGRPWPARRAVLDVGVFDFGMLRGGRTQAARTVLAPFFDLITDSTTNGGGGSRSPRILSNTSKSPRHVSSSSDTSPNVLNALTVAAGSLLEHCTTLTITNKGVFSCDVSVTLEGADMMAPWHGPWGGPGASTIPPPPPPSPPSLPPKSSSSSQTSDIVTSSFFIETPLVKSLPPGKSTTVRVWAFPHAPLSAETVRNALLLTVVETSQTVRVPLLCVATNSLLHVTTTQGGADAVQSEVIANFPATRAGRSSSQNLTLSNQGLFAIAWRAFEEPEAVVGAATAVVKPLSRRPSVSGEVSSTTKSIAATPAPIVSPFLVAPMGGLLLPGHTTSVLLTFSPPAETVATRLSKIRIEYVDEALGWEAADATRFAIASRPSMTPSVVAAAVPLPPTSSKGSRPSTAKETPKQVAAVAVPAAVPQIPTMETAPSTTSPSDIVLQNINALTDAHRAGGAPALSQVIVKLNGGAYTASHMIHFETEAEMLAAAAAAAAATTASIPSASGKGASRPTTAKTTTSNDAVPSTTLAHAPLPSSDNNSPRLLDFGLLKVGDQCIRHVIVTNNGSTPLTVRVAATPYPAPPSLRLQLDGAAPAELLVTEPSALTTVSPGTSLRVAFIFRSARPARLIAARLATLYVSDSVAGEVLEAVAIPVTASALSSAWSVNPPRAVSFGSLHYGKDAARALEIRNDGLFPFTFEIVPAGGDNDLRLLAAAAAVVETGGSAVAAVGTISSTPLAAAAVKGGAAATAAPPAKAKIPSRPATALNSGGGTVGGDAGSDVPLGEFGRFTLSTTTGTVPPGTTISVALRYFAAGLATHRTPIRVHISGSEATYPGAWLAGGLPPYTPSPKGAIDALLLDLIGESVSPAIDTMALEGIFEEQIVVGSLADLIATAPIVMTSISGDGEGGGSVHHPRSRSPSPVPLSPTLARSPLRARARGEIAERGGVAVDAPLLPTRSRAGFSRAERIFSFGAILLGAHPRGVTERFRVTNTSNVAVTVTSAIGGADAGVFELTPVKAALGPHESVYVRVHFKPSAVRSYVASFTADVEGGVVASAKQLTFALAGEGALPSVSLVAPPPSARDAASGILALSLGSAAPGAARRGGLHVRNNGRFAAAVRFALPQSRVFSFAPKTNSEAFETRTADGGRAVSLTLEPGEEGVMGVIFAPDAGAVRDAAAAAGDVTNAPPGFTKWAPDGGAEYNADVTMTVLGNSFHVERVRLVAITQADDLVIEGLTLPHNAAAVAADAADVLEMPTLLINAAGVGGSVTSNFTLRNASFAPLRFSLPPAHGVTFRPATGHIPPGNTLTVLAELTITPGTTLPLVLAPTTAEAIIRYSRITYEPSVAKVATTERSSIAASGRSTDALPVGKGGGAKAPATAPPPATAKNVGKGGGATATPPGTVRRIPPSSPRNGSFNEPTISWTSATQTTEPPYACVNVPGPFDSSATASTDGSPLSVNQEELNSLMIKLPLRAIADVARIGLAGPAGGGASSGQPPVAGGGAAVTKTAKNAPATLSTPLTGGDLPTTDSESALVFSSRAIAFRPTLMFAQRCVTFICSNGSAAPAHVSWTFDGGAAANGAAFSIEPSIVSIPANGNMSFIARFSPLDSGDLSTIAQLSLVGTNTTRNSISTAATPPLLSLPLTGRGLRPVLHIDVPPTDYLTRRDTVRAGLQALPIPAGARILDFISVGTNVRSTKSLTLVNPTSDAYDWNVEPLGTTNATSIVCTAQRGALQPGGRAQVTFDFTPTTQNPVEATFLISVPSHALSQPILVAGVVAEPRVSMNVASLNLGVLVIGATGSASLTITNEEHLPFAFEFSKEGLLEGGGHLRVTPSTGVVPPGGSIRVNVELEAREERAYNVRLECLVKRKPLPLSINVKADAFAVRESLLLLAAGAVVPSSLSADTSTTAVVPALPQSPNTEGSVLLSPLALGSIDFGPVRPGAVATRHVLISNAGVHAFDYDWTVGAAAAWSAAVAEAATGGGAAGVRALSTLKMKSGGGAIVSASPMATRTGSGIPQVRIIPARGRVPAGGQMICAVTFAPASAASSSFSGAPLSCTIGGAARYNLSVSGSSAPTALDWSTREIDFGDVFVPPSGGAVAPLTRTIRVRSREAVSDVTLAVLASPTPRTGVTIDMTAVTLSPGDGVDVIVSFVPRTIGSLTEVATFDVDGLSVTTLTVRANVLAASIELASASHAHTAFGSLRPGAEARRTIKLVNRAPRSVAVDLSFLLPNSNNSDTLPHGLTVSPSSFVLRARETIDIVVCYAPTSRAAPFSVSLAASVGSEVATVTDGGNAARTRPFLLATLTGASLGTTVHLDTSLISFGAVVAGASLTKTVVLRNGGDTPAVFSFNVNALSPNWSLTPARGRAAPGSDVSISVTFRPSAIAREIRTDPGTLSCAIEGLSSPLPLALAGSCVPRPPPTGAPTLFSCRVRERVVVNVALPKNDTDAPVTLAPSLTHEFFTGPATVLVPARGTATYPVTYSPLLSTAVPHESTTSSSVPLPSTSTTAAPPIDALFSYCGNSVHECALFLPYSDGSGILLPLAGTTTPGAPLPPVSIKTPAKASTPVAVPIYNALRVPQRFSVSWPTDAVPATATLAGPRIIDVPPFSSRDVRLVFAPTLEGVSRVPITLKSETFPSETLSVDLELTATPPGVAGALTLSATVRGSASHTIAIPIPPAFVVRPGGGPVPNWIFSSNHPALTVTRLPSGPEEALFSVVFRPTVPTDATSPASATTTVPSTATSSRPASGNNSKGGAKASPPISDTTLVSHGSNNARVTLAAADSLGVFVYDVSLLALPAGPEAPLRFSAPFGTRAVAAFRFKHSAPGPATFRASLINDGGGAFTVPATVSVSVPAVIGGSSDGAEGVIDVTYVGPSVGLHSGELRLEGDGGCGTFIVPLKGETGAPASAGPFILTPGAAGTQLEWISPFTDDRELTLTSDMPSVFVTTPVPGVVKAAKRTLLKLEVKYIPTPGGGAAVESARIVLVAKSRVVGEMDAVWVFYVRGVPVAAAGGGGGGSGTPAGAGALPPKKK